PPSRPCGSAGAMFVNSGAHPNSVDSGVPPVSWPSQLSTVATPLAPSLPNASAAAVAKADAARKRRRIADRSFADFGEGSEAELYAALAASRREAERMRIAAVMAPIQA